MRFMSIFSANLPEDFHVPLVLRFIRGLAICWSLFVFTEFTLAAQDSSEKFNDWVEAIENIPETGWIKYHVVQRDQDGTVLGKTFCEVVKKKRFGMARSVRGEEFTISGKQQELIAIENPYYSAMVKKIGEGKWTLESLALSSDANYSDIQHKSINRLDYLNTIRNYNGILSVLKSKQYNEDSHEPPNSAIERHSVSVHGDPGIKKDSDGFSPIERFQAEFSDGINLPTKISGKHRDRERYFAMTLSEWISVGDSTLPQQQIATTDDRDQGVTVTQELKLDFDSFKDPVDNSIFYLDHYGLPEPKIESPYRRYLIYGFFGIIAIALIVWFRLRRKRV